jgi:hypothetical protein
MENTAKLSPQLEEAVRRHRQWFGSYKASGELKRIQVWLTLKDGCIEFLTPADSYKVKRVLSNPHVVCFLGTESGPAISGMAEIVVDPDSRWRVYRAYWKTHPIMMGVFSASIRRRIKDGRQIVIRVHPYEHDVLAGITDPPL